MVQLQMQHFNSEMRDLYACTLLVGYAVIIATLFCTIFCAKECGLAATVLGMAIAMISLSVLKHSLEAAAGVWDASNNFRASCLLSNAVSGLGKKQLRSLRPIRVDISSTTFIDKGTFPYVLNDIIISNVINLLCGA